MYMRSIKDILLVFFYPFVTMKNLVFVCVLFLAFVLVVYSEAININDEQSFEMKRRQSSQCEPCGVRRLSCCFPNLCQHRSHKISKCYKVKG